MAVVPGMGVSQAGAAQRQRTMQQRAEADIVAMVENVKNMLKASQVNDTVRNAQEVFQIEVHAARVVHSGEALLRLVSELKQSAVFTDFASLNRAIAERTRNFEARTEEVHRSLDRLGEEVTIALAELEAHYYSSACRETLP